MFYSTVSELTIKELAPQISAMAPVIISVNGGEYYWSDDIDLTHVSDEEGNRLFKENIEQYHQILKLDLLVSNISYDIVDYHHSIVRITTRQ